MCIWPAVRKLCTENIKTLNHPSDVLNHEYNITLLHYTTALPKAQRINPSPMRCLAMNEMNQRVFIGTKLNLAICCPGHIIKLNRILDKMHAL